MKPRNTLLLSAFRRWIISMWTPFKHAQNVLFDVEDVGERDKRQDWPPSWPSPDIPTLKVIEVCSSTTGPDSDSDLYDCWSQVCDPKLLVLGQLHHRDSSEIFGEKTFRFLAGIGG
jgi:hypothetical protein